MAAMPVPVIGESHPLLSSRACQGRSKPSGRQEPSASDRIGGIAFCGWDGRSTDCGNNVATTHARLALIPRSHWCSSLIPRRYFVAIATFWGTTGMTWKEERDALIAQTMAFVQSVTGKPADFAQFDAAAPATAPIVSQPLASPPLVSPPLESQPLASHTTGLPLVSQPVISNPENAASMTMRSAPSPLQAGRPREAAAQDAAATRQATVAPERFTSIASQLQLQRDMQTEIRARVARFRAHQERFNRERQAYFSETIARLKASADGTPLPED